MLRHEEGGAGHQAWQASGQAGHDRDKYFASFLCSSLDMEICYILNSDTYLARSNQRFLLKHIFSINFHNYKDLSLSHSKQNRKAGYRLNICQGADKTSLDCFSLTRRLRSYHINRDCGDTILCLSLLSRSFKTICHCAWLYEPHLELYLCPIPMLLEKCARVVWTKSESKQICSFASLRGQSAHMCPYLLQNIWGPVCL